MADPAPYPNGNDTASGDIGAGTRVRPDLSSPPSTPRWVRAFAVFFVTLVVLFIILHLTGNGFSGMHSQAPSAGAIAGAIQQGAQQLWS